MGPHPAAFPSSRLHPARIKNERANGCRVSLPARRRAAHRAAPAAPSDGTEPGTGRPPRHPHPHAPSSCPRGDPAAPDPPPLLRAGLPGCRCLAHGQRSPQPRSRHRCLPGEPSRSAGAAEPAQGRGRLQGRKMVFSQPCLVPAAASALPPQHGAKVSGGRCAAGWDSGWCRAGGAGGDGGDAGASGAPLLGVSPPSTGLSVLWKE